MDKSAESRSDSSADSKKSNQNPHLSDEQLLLALDGELSVRQAAKVQAHLEACWSCRARREQIEKVIGDVVEYRDCLVRRHFPLSTGGRAMFIAQLEQLARCVGRPSLWSRIVGGLRVLRALSQSVVPRHVWISAMVMASFAFFLFTRLWEVPKVSASQLLENSQVFEVRKLHSVPKPVVYQKLHIRIGMKAVTRTIYRDPVGMRQADHLDVTGEPVSNADLSGQSENRSDSVQAAQAEFQRTFLTARLNWQDPLSPASYSAWHNSLSEKQDEVTAAGHDLLALKTTTREGSIAEARITVRAADFHPVAEELRLRDTRQVEVKELAWEVLPMEAINPAIFSPGPTLAPEVPSSVNLVPAPPRPTDAQLAEAELQARVAMHAERADLGEQLELDRNAPGSAPSSGQRSVIVRGIVNTPERKNELLAVLRGIPHLDLRLQTVEEAAAQQNRATDKSEDVAPPIAQEAAAREDQVADESMETTGHEVSEVAVGGSPALERQLEEWYPKAEDRAAFVNRALELVQDAIARAWALRRLRDRYSPDIVAELSPGSRQTLESLIRDHVSVLRQDVDGARNMVSPLLPPKPMADVPPPSTMLEVPPPATASTNGWHSTVTEIFPEMQTVHDNLATLLAGSGEVASETQTLALALDLQSALAKLETQLPVLYNHVSGPFLSEPKASDKLSSDE